jgi:hypothetical protein
MSIYTVHEPPRQPAGAAPDAARFGFVRDGFSFWAFLLAPCWMLWHGMWLVLLAYLIAIGVVFSSMVVLGASSVALAVIGLLVAILVGLESSTLRRFTLKRRGWRSVAVVSGRRLEDAERRFFDNWRREPPDAPPASAAPLPSAPPAAGEPPGPVARLSQPAAIVGLFPEPGAGR